MKTKVFVLLFSLALLFFACSCKNSAEKSTDIGLINDEIPGNTNTAPEEQKTDLASAGEYRQKDKEVESTSPEVEPEKIPQKIIKTADISYKVDKYNTARQNILETIKRHNGYVSSENQSGDEYRTTNTLVIRVGSADFDVLVDELLKIAVFVDYKKISAEDVTEEYVDVTARLKSKKDAMLQYETILKKANTINDILNVQQYIRTLQEEIESLEGRLKYLNSKVELSTINLTFYEQGNIIPSQSESFGYKFKKTLSWGWHGFVAFFLAVIYLWPLWVVGLITFFVIRYFIRKARKKRAAKQQKQ